jgi:hypothetical protein
MLTPLSLARGVPPRLNAALCEEPKSYTAREGDAAR